MFPTRRAVFDSVIGTDMAIGAVSDITSDNQSVNIPSNGIAAVLMNKSYGFVELYVYENSSASAVTIATGAGEHICITYTKTSSTALSSIAMGILGTEFAAILDDLTPTDSNAALLIIPNAYADLISIKNKYSS